MTRSPTRRHARLGALDLAGMTMLQALSDTARAHGAEVRLTPVVVPAYWGGPLNDGLGPTVGLTGEVS
ncbi:hypothetical protein OOK36_56165 [Streptomyces sp. NBC_00365]|uniref:hypothetical protein n=1 Tax=Streptomyces sp. NBC_00365 TaxID=2975726 RepID=UPI0022518EB9|nr:hypothetical protein [Streptomyces sp. NBC_00365]MCX5097791.1 hypothetical protein [Streptomyces sp. NBC_00365]